jgi:hypothetical protein
VPKLPILPIPTLSDEADMRAFYKSCGIRTGTTELAIKARRDFLVGPPKKPHPMKGMKTKPRPQG